MIMKNIVAFLLCMLPYLTMEAQTVVQPKIMVIPYTKEGEDIRTILENDENKRIALAKIKEAFDERGINTIDFVAKLKAIESANVFNMENQLDIKSQIIDMSGADIYVEAEIVCNQNSSASSNKSETRIKIVITAYDCATGASLSNKIGESGTFYTNDIAKLAMKAITSCADDFLRVMQMKFSDISENGRSLMLQIGFEEGSMFTMESEVGTQGLLLQDEIELWVEAHSYNGNYHLQGVSPVKMIFDDIKLPLVDEATGNNYSTSKFGIEMLKFFRSLNIPISRSNKGNTLYITIK
ncbi:MAG: hypothetical protein K2G43_06410 [Bacteroides sp.]|nr:hypothetical protein [Bacteroides sp.]